MRIVVWIAARAVIDQILTHLRTWAATRAAAWTGCPPGGDNAD